MRRAKYVLLVALLLLPGVLGDFTRPAGADEDPAAINSEAVSSLPRDVTPYVRALVPGEAPLQGFGPMGMVQPYIFPTIAVIDTVINNTNANLTNTDGANDGECTIAVNPADTDEIAISAFSGGWSGPGSTAVLYHTTDGGATWTRVGVPPPPGWNNGGCPCDWAWDWGQGGLLSGTILATLAAGVDVVSVVTNDATSPAAYAYNGNPAQRTNNNVPGSFTNADQPWLLTNRTPGSPAVDNVYVAWDDFNNSDGISGVDMRCAVSGNVSPLNFTFDTQIGNATGAVNPGLRMADDRGSGVMWALWGRNVAAGDDASKGMNYMLNRSTDGGATWTLNGDPGLPATAGIVVATADSDQPWPKFGGVNALLGGVHHAAVDPRNGDLYYVYGDRDAATNNNRLSIRRITDAGGGAVSVGAASFVTGQVQAALPSVAVLDNGTVGVFYYTYDGVSGGFPQFTAHFSISRNQGATWTDQVLVQFLSSAAPSADPNDRQRVLGDYMQVKAVGYCFYGAFTANGAPFGRAISNHDPIYFFTCAPNVIIDCPPPQNVECDVQETLTFNVDELNNQGVTVTFEVDGVPVPGQTKVIGAGSTPTTADFDFTFSGMVGQTFDVKATATSTSGEAVDCTVTVTLVDTTPPTLNASVVRTLLYPARNGMIPVGYSASASDSCGIASLRVDVYSDEPNGAAPWTPDASDMGTAASLRLRMERAYPGGNGRVYLIIAVATDNGGNTAVNVQRVIVPTLPTGFNILAVTMEAAVAAAGVNPTTGAPPASHANLIHSFNPPP